MYIQTQETPNPHTLKFIPDRKVTEGVSRQFDGPHSAEGSPLPVALFELADVTGVYVAPDFVSVTKAPSADWASLKLEALTVLMDHFHSGRPALEGERLEGGQDEPEETDPVIRQIKAIIEEKVRPAVAMDGGDIIFRAFENGVVYLEMRGACSGCPSSTVTLKNGVENMLKHYVPEVESVESI